MIESMTGRCDEKQSCSSRTKRRKGGPSTFGALVASVLWLLAVSRPGKGATVTYDLTVAEEEVQIAGRMVVGMTINHQIPGPVLRFTEGDLARIRVHNRMKESTSIHWHGLLVPPGMDGVPLVSFPPIQPGATFTYEFPIRQSGTYWYHTHSDLQEQLGLYGAIVIRPRNKPVQRYREAVIVFSDWTNENPHAVNRMLKRGSEWYAVAKGSAQSLLGAVRLGMLGDYMKRELQRMPPMDISDVAYDWFLANGKPEISIAASPGETLRLRLVDGSATTYFHLEFAGGTMTIVAADGVDVRPVKKKRFLIAVAETYDVLVKVPDGGAYELRATAHDGSGYASVWIGSGPRHPAPDIPRPNLYAAMGHLRWSRVFALTPAAAMGMSDRAVRQGRFDSLGMMSMRMNMSGSRTGMGPTASGMRRMAHVAKTAVLSSTTSGGGGRAGRSPPASSRPPSGKRFSKRFGLLAADVAASANLAVDGMDPRRPWAPYADLRAVKSTGFPPDRPVREIRLTLDGDMERYVWFLNNKPLSEEDSILIRKGEVVRFIMINRTMMHHPMHLHGHFFRVINGQGEYSPLKHTVDVAPMSTTVIEFDANEFGDWFFHCHLLYHMKAGMSRVVHYDGYTVSPRLQALRVGLSKDSWYWWGQADVLSNMTEGFLTLNNTRNILTAEWEAGWKDVEEIESEGVFTWDRYVNRFFTVLAGLDVLGTNSHVDKRRGVVGFRYLLPLNVECTNWVDTDGGARASLCKSVDLTPRINMNGRVEYDTHDLWEGAAGVSYLLGPNVSLRLQWHSDYGWGAGVQIRF